MMVVTVGMGMVMMQISIKHFQAEQCCQLQHIVHLWQLVTTKRAKILLEDQQV